MLNKLLPGTLFLAVVLLFSCSDDQTVPTGPADSPPVKVDTLAVTPASGAPGSLIEITGFDLDPTDTTVTVYVGDLQTVFSSDSLAVKALIPLFLDSASGW